MTDQPQAQQQGNVPLAVSLQYLKDLSFESPRAPQVFVTQGPQSQVNVNVRVDGRGVGENTYEITLHLEVKANAGEDAAPKPQNPFRHKFCFLLSHLCRFSSFQLRLNDVRFACAVFSV